MKAISISHILIPGAAAALLALSTGCSRQKWHAEGTVAGGENKELILEAPNNYGGWYPIDTIEVNAKGTFSIAGEPVGHPEVYRLTLNGQSLYFPIDSIESISIAADAGRFATDYTLSGSDAAEQMQKLNDLIASTVSKQGEAAVAYDPELKRALSEMILRDPAGIVAYYTIFRRVGNTLIFDPAQKSDLRIIGAVANAFATKRPNDPRTEFLSNFYVSGRKQSGAAVPTDTIVAQEIQLPEISLLDNSGKPRSLSEVASHGNVVVLNFTAYAAEGSPAYNIELAKVFNASKDRGLQIYQVSVDNDEFLWKQAAANLPWITVYNSPKDGAQNLLKYNVGTVPALFIINRDGDLVERVESIDRLQSAVNRYL